MLNINPTETIKRIYSVRNLSSRKYDHGLVIVIGGSKIYTGSPVLSALGSLRSGADVAQIIAPERVADIAAGFSPNIITFPMKGDHLSPEHLPEILSLVKIGEDVSHGKVAVVIGGGVGRDQKTKQTIRQFIEKTSVPVVIDADGIYAFEKGGSFVFNAQKDNNQIIFTPHLYEFFILSGKNTNNLSQEEIGSAVLETAKDIKATILLKGKMDYVSDGVELATNNINVPYMTTGGTGDVLAGIAGSLLARGCPSFIAGCGAAVINTLAGQVASKSKGEGLMATDVIKKIPFIIKKYGQN